MIKVEVIPGHALSEKDLQIINFWRKKEFNSSTEWNKENSKAYYDSVIFLVKQKDEILSFGRLKPVTLQVGEQQFPIMGIAAIVAIVKGKGYGKRLMDGIANYLNEHKQTGIGFCGPHITTFYQECGFQVVRNGQGRFKYIDENDKKHEENGDVIYQCNNRELLYLLVDDKTIFTHYTPHW